MPRTAEQEAADAQLAEAIARSARAYGQGEEYVTSAWFVIAQSENMTDSEDEMYSVFTPSAQFPRFSSVGLLHTALSMIDAGFGRDANS